MKHLLLVVITLFLSACASVSESIRLPELLDPQSRSDMAVRLVDDENEWSVELAVDEDLREALLIQAQRYSEHVAPSSPFLRRLRHVISELVSEAVDPDIQPPTQAQLNYALAISKRLGVNLPYEALRYRGTMVSFIARHDTSFRNRKVRN